MEATNMYKVFNIRYKGKKMKKIDEHYSKNVAEKFKTTKKKILTYLTDLEYLTD